MKKRIEKYLPTAMNIIEKVEIADENGNVNNKFNGYFSSFGAAIVLSGVKSALAFYSNKKTAKERVKILQAIYMLIVGSEDVPGETALLEYYIKNENRYPLLKQKILDAAIALKLAVRTYKLVD